MVMRVYQVAACVDGGPGQVFATGDRATVPTLLNRFPAAWVGDKERIRLARYLARPDRLGAYNLSDRTGGLHLIVADVDAAALEAE